MFIIRDPEKNYPFWFIITSTASNHEQLGTITASHWMDRLGLHEFSDNLNILPVTMKSQRTCFILVPCKNLMTTIVTYLFLLSNNHWVCQLDWISSRVRGPLFSHNIYHYLLKAKVCTKVQYKSSVCPDWYSKSLMIYHSHNNTYEIGNIETNKKTLKGMRTA